MRFKKDVIDPDFNEWLFYEALECAVLKLFPELAKIHEETQKQVEQALKTPNQQEVKSRDE
jgi:hypothetical protein